MAFLDRDEKALSGRPRPRMGAAGWAHPQDSEFHHLEVHFHSRIEQQMIVDGRFPPLDFELDCHQSTVRHRHECVV